MRGLRGQLPPPRPNVEPRLFFSVLTVISSTFDDTFYGCDTRTHSDYFNKRLLFVVQTEITPVEETNVAVEEPSLDHISNEVRITFFAECKQITITSYNIQLHDCRS